MTINKKVNDNHYHISGLNLKKNRFFVGPFDTCYVEHSNDVHLYFENGVGSNGLTDRLLLEVIVARLETTQGNQQALAHAREALNSLGNI